MEITKDIFQKAFQTLCTAKAMTEIYEENFKEVSKYVHATSRGHEAVQIVGDQALEFDDRDVARHALRTRRDGRGW